MSSGVVVATYVSVVVVGKAGHMKTYVFLGTHVGKLMSVGVVVATYVSLVGVGEAERGTVYFSVAVVGKTGRLANPRLILVHTGADKVGRVVWSMNR